MTNEQLLLQCKIGLNVPPASTAFDAVLTQKLKAVKSFMIGAGVAPERLDDDAAVEVIVLGVTDIWQLQGGEAKFSTIFMMMLTQLACRPDLEVP